MVRCLTAHAACLSHDFAGEADFHQLRVKWAIRSRGSQRHLYMMTLPRRLNAPYSLGRSPRDVIN